MGMKINEVGSFERYVQMTAKRQYLFLEPREYATYENWSGTVVGMNDGTRATFNRASHFSELPPKILFDVQGQSQITCDKETCPPPEPEPDSCDRWPFCPLPKPEPRPEPPCPRPPVPPCPIWDCGPRPEVLDD